jgi:hypothetical protein
LDGNSDAPPLSEKEDLTMKWDPISRRQFLQGSIHGALQVSLALPLLESLLPRAARAALPTSQPVRLIALMVPHGSLNEDRFFSSRLAANLGQNAQGELYRYEALANFFGAGQPFDLLLPERAATSFRRSRRWRPRSTSFRDWMSPTLSVTTVAARS